MSIYISGVEYDQKRTQDPTFLDKTTVRQRFFNQDTGQYENTQGNAFTVERIMPVPYTLRLTVDIWTTSEQQRLEIVEQLGVLFNPSIDIRSNSNIVDWTNLSVIYQDGLTYNSRTAAAGTANPMDITSWKFYMPIWLSSPIKVSKLGIIQKIISNIHKGSTLLDLQNDDLLLGTRQKVTPYGYKVLLVGNNLQILPANQPGSDNDNFEVLGTGPNTSVYWSAILNVYGKVRPGVSQIALENEYMMTEVVGTIDFNPDDDRLLTFTVDPETLPQDTLTAVDMVIDPIRKYPDGTILPVSVAGQRYLIVKDIPQQKLYAQFTFFGIINGTTLTVTNGVLDGTVGSSIVGTGVVENTVIDVVNSCEFVAYISGNQLMVLDVTSGTLDIGMALSGSGITTGTYITNFGTGTGGVGSYDLNISPTSIGDPSATFSGYTDGDTITITSVSSGTIFPGLLVAGPNITAGTVVVSQESGVFGDMGVYKLSDPSTGASNPQFTGYIKGTTLTVTSVTSGTLAIGLAVRGKNVFSGTRIIGFNSGSGGVGTYTVDTEQVVGSTAKQVAMVGVDVTVVDYLGSGVQMTATSYTLSTTNNIPTATRLNAVVTYASRWPGLTTGARANDIIQYGTIGTNVTTEFTPAGSTVITVKSVDGIVEGMVATFTSTGASIVTGGPVTVLNVDYNNRQVVIDTATTLDFPNETALTFSGDGWYVDFENATIGQPEYVTNTTTGIQYRNNDGVWRQSYTGYYDQGQWRVII